MHEFIPMPQALKIPDAKAAVEKECEKLEKNTGMTADESEKQKWGDRWSKEKGQNRTLLCVVNGRLPSHEIGVGVTVSELQRSNCTPRWHCERWFRVVCSIHWARIIGVTNDGCKSDRCHFKTTRQTQYLLTPRSKWKMHHHCSKFRSQNVQTFGYVYQNTNGLNHGPVWKIQSFLWSEICTVILRQDYCGKGNSRTFY